MGPNSHEGSLIDVTIRMFGGLAIQVDEARVNLAPNLTGAILAYLALHPGRQIQRDELIAVLWPDEDPVRARQNLRQRVHVLKRLLDDAGCGHLLNGSTRLTLGLTEVTSDFVQFRELIQQIPGLTDSAQKEKALLRALDLYAGPLLAGMHFDCFMIEQQLCADQFRSAVEQLTHLYCERHDLENALDSAMRWSAADPLSEAARCALFKIYAAKGDASSIIRQYRSLEEAFFRELRDRPSAAVKEEYQRCLAAAKERSSQVELGEAPQPPQPMWITQAPRAVGGKKGRRIAAFFAAVSGIWCVWVFSSGTGGEVRAPGSPFRTLTTVFQYSSKTWDASRFAYNHSQEWYGKGYAGPAIREGRLILTDGYKGLASSVWLKERVPIHGFVTRFSFRVLNPKGNPGDLADGFTFTLQDAGPKSLGKGGGDLGYKGIAKSLSIKFDLFGGNEHQSGCKRLWDFYYDGCSPTGGTELKLDIGNGSVYDASLSFDGLETFEIFLRERHTPNVEKLTVRRSLSSILKNRDSKAWVGFTGGTGMGWSRVEILDWRFSTSRVRR